MPGSLIDLSQASLTLPPQIAIDSSLLIPRLRFRADSDGRSS